MLPLISEEHTRYATILMYAVRLCYCKFNHYEVTTGLNMTLSEYDKIWHGATLYRHELPCQNLKICSLTDTLGYTRMSLYGWTWIS